MAEACELVHVSEKKNEYVMLTKEKVNPKLMGEASMCTLIQGASNHMTGDRDKFVDLNNSINGSMRFGDASIVNLCGCGSVLFKCLSGEHKVLTYVYYLPQLKSNIISLGQLDENGCKSVIDDGILSIFDRQKQLLVRVKMSKKRLYALNLKLTRPVCLLASMDDSAWVWHARYEHLNFHALRNLANREMVIGMPLLEHVD